MASFFDFFRPSNEQGFFAPDPYGGTAPWADALMQLGGGLMAAGAPGGSSADIGRAFQGISRSGDRRAQRQAMAEQGRRADEGLQLQKAAFELKKTQAEQQAARQAQLQAALGLPVAPAGDATRATQETGLLGYKEPPLPGMESVGLMPTPQGAFMGEGYLGTVPEEMRGTAAAVLGSAGTPAETMSAIRMIEGMKNEPRQRQYEVEKQAMLDAGMSEDDYNTWVMNKNRYRPYVDEYGNRRIMDLLKPGGAVAPQTAALPEPEVGEAPVDAPGLGAPERVAGVPNIPEGYEEAFGWSGAFNNAVNSVATLFGRDLPFEQSERAKTAVETMNTRTKLEMSEGIPGRPSNLTREELGKLGVEPGSIFTSPQKAKIRVEETVGTLNSQIENFDRIAADQNAPADQRQAAMRKASTLKEIRNGWQQVLDNFENPYRDYSREQMNELDTTQMSQQELEAAAQRYDELEKMGR